MRALQLVAALTALSGLAKIGSALINMDNADGAIIFGSILSFAGVLAGIVASILAKYYETKMLSTAESGKIALDALSQLGEQYAKKRQQK